MAHTTAPKRQVRLCFVLTLIIIIIVISTLFSICPVTSHKSSLMSYHKTTRMPASRPRVAFTMIKRLGTIHIDCPGRGRKRSSTFAIFCFRCHRAIPECAAHVGVVVAVSAEISPSTPKPPVPVPRIGLATCVFGIACSSAPGLLDVVRRIDRRMKPWSSVTGHQWIHA